MTILKQYRINNELSQEKMAQKLKMSLPAYRNYENGKRVLPPQKLLLFLKIRNASQDTIIIQVLEELYGKEE